MEIMELEAFWAVAIPLLIGLLLLSLERGKK
jgi:hypothetical protein